MGRRGKRVRRVGIVSAILVLVGVGGFLQFGSGEQSDDARDGERERPTDDAPPVSSNPDPEPPPADVARPDRGAAAPATEDERPVDGDAGVGQDVPVGVASDASRAVGDAGTPIPTGAAGAELTTESEGAGVASAGDASRPALDSDALASVRATVVRAVGDGRFDLAYSAVDDAARHGVEPAVRATLRTDVDRGLQARVDDVSNRVAAGHVLGSVATLRDLRAQRAPRVDAAVDALLARWGVAGEHVVTTGEPLAAPAALVRGLAIRAHRARSSERVEMLEGTVRSERRGAVTLRVVRNEGELYPVVPRSSVEPQRVDAALALDQAVVALREGDGLLAAAWIGCAAARSAAGDANFAARLVAVRARLVAR